MTTFQTTIPDDLKRCQQALKFRERITITAAVDGTIRPVTGMVVAIEPVHGAVPMWEVTINEAKGGSRS